MTKLEELEKDFTQIKLDLKAIQHDMKNLETRILVAEKDVLTINNLAVLFIWMSQLTENPPQFVWYFYDS
ncbi:hypothetical protein OCA16_19480 [Bacillus cereus]|nr:hypothetical protein [Bacillus cereus]